MADSRHLDGDWVRARPYGWDDVATGDNVILGGAETRANVAGMLTVVRSDLTGAVRYAVNGVTVDPATIVVVDPPSH